VSARDVLAALPEVPAVAAIQRRLGATSDGQRAAAAELALEALYLAKRIDKVTGDGETVYG
jgi:magnesium chelatase subunit I